MLGRACDLVFSDSGNFETFSTARTSIPDKQDFDAASDSVDELIQEVAPDWVINCIGVIKPHIKEESAPSVSNAIQINGLFPHALAAAIKGSNTKVIQIATDCVYTGIEGGYREDAPHDPTDVYGKTKSLGEVNSDQFLHIRASIIGPEYGRSTSLQEWFLGQPQGATVNGFTDHLWNGLTTHHFALLSKAVVKTDLRESGKYHILPGNVLTKAELLEAFAHVYDRTDIKINAMASSNKVDRTLKTNNLEFSNSLWKLAGYENPPTIQQMISEQKTFTESHK
jgi:dTDP-4-dehydrorhamnose reductase